jgi:hypothetical protein
MSISELEDTEENYRLHLAQLISRTKSRGGTRYFRQYVNRCKGEAAAAFPIGSAAVSRKEANVGFFVGLLSVLASLFSIFG